MQKLLFEKWHGIGNDFVILDHRNNNLELTSEQIKKICNRNFGVGCDQLIILTNSDTADVGMSIFNADGSSAEFCGNATRCIAKKITNAKTIQSGKLLLSCIDSEKDVKILLPPAKNVFSLRHNLIYIDVGNPHIVKIFDDIDSIDLEYEKSLIGKVDITPNDYNFECIEIKNSHTIKMRVFERGTGETLACGSGGAAAFLACNHLKLIKDSAQVQLLGGNLEFNLTENGVIMSGPAEKVFEGSIVV